MLPCVESCLKEKRVDDDQRKGEGGGGGGGEEGGDESPSYQMNKENLAVVRPPVRTSDRPIPTIIQRAEGLTGGKFLTNV